MSRKGCKCGEGCFWFLLFKLDVARQRFRFLYIFAGEDQPKTSHHCLTQTWTHTVRTTMASSHPSIQQVTPSVEKNFYNRKTYQDHQTEISPWEKEKNKRKTNFGPDHNMYFVTKEKKKERFKQTSFQDIHTQGYVIRYPQFSDLFGSIKDTATVYDDLRYSVRVGDIVDNG